MKDPRPTLPESEQKAEESELMQEGQTVGNLVRNKMAFKDHSCSYCSENFNLNGYVGLIKFLWLPYPQVLMVSFPKHLGVRKSILNQHLPDVGVSIVYQLDRVQNDLGSKTLGKSVMEILERVRPTLTVDVTIPGDGVLDWRAQRRLDSPQPWMSPFWGMGSWTGYKEKVS